MNPGDRVRGPDGPRPRPRRSAPPALDQRGRLVDYALQRRALLGDIRAGRRSLTEACDAHPHLLLAARHYGETAPQNCPVCAKDSLRNVHYVYGDALGAVAGQAKSLRELELMQDVYREFDVYVVEVCSGCNWNHLVRTFVLGSAGRSA